MARLARLFTVTAVTATLAVTALAVPAAARAENYAVAVAASPGVAFGQAARLPTADEHTAGSKVAEDGAFGLDPVVQHIIVGTALLGGAFTLGLVATGSLSTGLAAAGAVAISYAVLP